MAGETSKNFIADRVAAAVESLGLGRLEPQVSVPEPAFGDYATNAALVIAKQARQNPQALARQIIDHIRQSDTLGMFSEISEARGFINFRLSSAYLLKNLQAVLEQRELYGCSLEGQGQTVVFEYSSPNTNKALHIGHTRNDLYGKACINLLRANGYKVVACEIINDRGIHIMKSVLMYMKHGQGKTPESENMKPDHFVGKFYQMFGQEAAESPETETALLEEAQRLLQKWEAGDGEVRTVWKQMNDWFYAGATQTYAREGTEFDEVDYESQIYDKGRDLVLQGVAQGIFRREPDESVSVEFADKNLGKKYLLRKDGTTIYVTQDMYLWDVRNRRHRPHIAMVTTAAEQAYHFKVLAELFRLMKYEWAGNFRHLPYEHVYLGKNKMSSRGGNTVTADELVESVKARVKTVMAGLQKLKGSADDDALLEMLAYGAIKYGYLKYEPNTRIYFDLDSTIALEGNTGIYLQYAYARLANILKKAGSVSEKIEAAAPLNEWEAALMRKLLHFPETVSLAAAEYKPNLLCNYIFELSQTLNGFYENCPVLQETNEGVQQLRLQLIAATAQVLKNGLQLLGIEAPEEM